MVATFCEPEPLSKDVKAFSAGAGSGCDRVHAAGRGRTAEGGAALLEVADLGGVGARVAVGDHAVDEVAVLDRQAEQVAHVLELVHRELLHLVVGVLGGEAGAEVWPLTVWARITVGAPLWASAAR